MTYRISTYWMLVCIFNFLVHFLVLYFLLHLGYVWFLESTKEIKEILKKNDFIIFGCFIENSKEN